MILVTTYYDGPSLSEFKYKNFTESQIKFLAACIIQSLKYIREKKIIHRDIFLGNVILDKDKYFNLIDFSCSIDYSNRKAKKFFWHGLTVSSPPEALKHSTNNFNSDYYTLGHLIIFLIFKKYLLKNRGTKNLTELVLKYNMTNKYSKELFNFLNKIIENNMENRLGYKNINELMNHPWFNNIIWKDIEMRKIVSPFRIITINITDHICFDFIKKEKEVEKYMLLIKSKFYKKIIKNFDYSNKWIQ